MAGELQMVRLGMVDSSLVSENFLFRFEFENVSLGNDKSQAGKNVYDGFCFTKISLDTQCPPFRKHCFLQAQHRAAYQVLSECILN